MNEINIFKIDLKDGKTGFEELWHKEKGKIRKISKIKTIILNPDIEMENIVIGFV